MLIYALCCQLSRVAFTRFLSWDPPECQDWGAGGGAKPILAMPGFSRLLKHPPLPNSDNKIPNLTWTQTRVYQITYVFSWKQNDFTSFIIYLLIEARNETHMAPLKAFHLPYKTWLLVIFYDIIDDDAIIINIIIYNPSASFVISLLIEARNETRNIWLLSPDVTSNTKHNDFWWLLMILMMTAREPCSLRNCNMCGIFATISIFSIPGIDDDCIIDDDKCNCISPALLVLISTDVRPVVNLGTCPVDGPTQIFLWYLLFFVHMFTTFFRNPCTNEDCANDDDRCIC